MTETPARGSFRAVVGGAHGSQSGTPADSGAAADLLDRATRASRPTEFVVTPERLHRRNLKRGLADRARPRSSLRLTDAASIADELLDAAGAANETIDRIDRLNHLDAELDRDTEANDRLRASFGSELPARVETIAAAHSRVGEMTGWDADRLGALRTLADGLSPVAARDAEDVVAGVHALERRFVDRVGAVHSRETLLPAAAETLRDRPTLWQETFPAAERLSVAGVSAVDASLLDLLDAAAGAGVAVTLYLRPGTGPEIADRLDDRLRDDAQVVTDHSGGIELGPAAELVADTPEAEARLAAAVVAGHLRAGASPSDVLVVARDASEYERPLRRATRRHGVQLAVWAQLPVERTIPYRQFAAVCQVLGTDELDLDRLLTPLEFQWVHPALADEDVDATAWPLSTAHLGELRTALAAEVDGQQSRTIAEWQEAVATAVESGEIPPDRVDPLRQFLAWARSQPTTPSPEAIHGTFEPLVEAGREVALPSVFTDDTADLGRTSRYARALSRIEELLIDTRAKYREWLAAGDVPRSWLAVADLAERVIATRPGRREHANAAAVDVIDATDAWLRDAPHVVAVGLVDGVWPRRIESVFPDPLRHAVVAGDSAAARRLAVPGRWTPAREVDHLASGLGAATETLACTRYRRDREGTSRERSPLLATVPTEPVEASAAQSLLATGTLPDALAADGGGAR